MKYNKLLLILSVILILFLTVTIKAIAEEILPAISTVCENRLGILTSVNDGFSILKECPKGSRKVLLIGEKGPKGDTGIQGPQGPTGPQGATGSKGDSGITIQSFYTKTYGPYQTDFHSGNSIHMECNTNEIAISGGLSYTEGDPSFFITAKTGPSSSGQNAWDLFITYTSIKPVSFTTTVNCLKLQ